MPRLTNTIEIDAVPAEVYAVLRDLDAYPTWLRRSRVYRGTAAPVVVAAEPVVPEASGGPRDAAASAASGDQSARTDDDANVANATAVNPANASSPATPSNAATTSRPPSTPHTTYTDTTLVGRMHGELLDDIPARTLRFHQRTSSGTLDAVILYRLEPAGDGTLLTRVGDLTTRGMLRLGQPILVRMAAAESERTLSSLKAHLERRETP